jgi:hypothetical protein
MVVGALATFSALTAALVVGCSSEETHVTADAGGDQTTPDVVSPEGGGNDAGDAGADVKLDGPPNPAAFAQEVIDAVCNKYRSCCTGIAFDMARCRGLIEANGGAFGETVDINLADAGRVTYDSTKGAQCLAAINALGCTNVSGAEVIAGRSVCIGALTGTQGAGQPCRAAIECQAGHFCNLPTDGGSGSCAALRGDGGPCGDFGAQDPTSFQPQQACSYRGNGATGLSCVVGDYNGINDAGTGYLNPDQWFCLPQTGLGTPCSYNQDCASGICDPNTFTCANSGFLVDDAGAVCTAFEASDAGTD